MRIIGSPRLFVIAAGALAAGCLDEVGPLGEGAVVMCEIQEDCDTAAGEVCDEGVCWGNPPASTRLAAVLIPPEDRPDLAAREIPELMIEPDGMTRGLELGPSVRVSGRVVLACGGFDDLPCGPDASIPARIQITRPSAIPGGPRFSRTISARGGVAAGEEAFTMRLPPVGDGEQPYEVTIRPGEPEGDADTERALEMAAPPLRTLLAPARDEKEILWVLGEPSQHVQLAGVIVDAAGRGIAERRVYTVGRWPGGAEGERISTTATTDALGAFRLLVPAEVEGPVSLVSRPPPGEVAPRITLRGIELPELDPSVELDPSDSLDLGELVMPSYPAPARFAVPIDGNDSGGGKVPVEGAKVTMETLLPSEPGIEATFSATATTDESGIAELMLIPAGEKNRPYETRITTASGSQHASSHILEIAVGPGARESTSFLAAITLPRRILVDGEIRDAAGIPVEAAQIEAQISPRLSWTLDATGRALVAEHRSPNATTDESGRFVLWLDPMIADRQAIYDLAVVPPARMRVPRWSIDGLDVGPDSAGVALGVVDLPPGSHARGMVTASGEPVPGAELWLYEIDVDSDLCDAAHAPGGEACVAPARLRGLWRTSDSGSVWLVLPNPD
jgi:hypothetical protein